jgi:hypothetical protein
MSAMMVVLKLYQTRQETFSSALSVLHGALEAQCKAQKRACKLARKLAMAQQEFGDSKVLQIIACSNGDKQLVKEMRCMIR